MTSLNTSRHRLRQLLRRGAIGCVVAACFAPSVCLAQSAPIKTLPADPSRPVVLTYQRQINGNIAVSQVVSTVSATSGNAPPIAPVSVTTTVVPLGVFLSSPVHYLWNGFLTMQNVVGMLNRSGTPLDLTVRMLDQDGSELSATALQVPPNGEYDLAVNLLPGFRVNALGVLQVEFAGNAFDGNGFFYRYAKDGRTLEFMTGAPFESRLLGPSFASYNTIQPSRRTTQLANEVTSWLAVSNLNQTAEKDFTVELYDQSGNLVQSKKLTVPPRGRRDVSAGHENPGPGHVGLIRIVPADNNSAYTASIIRYGASAPSSALAKFYHFSVLTPAQRASSTFEWGQISRGGDGENWVVLSNTSNTAGDFNLSFRSNSGAQLGDMNVHLNGFAQIHLFANGLLAPAESGVVKVTALTPNSFVAESDFYFYDRANGELTAAYSSLFRRPTNADNIGSYNTFLGQYNYLKAFNVNDVGGATTVNNVTISQSSGSAIGSADIALAPEQGLELALHDLPFAPASGSYGPISLTDPTLSVIADVLRLQYSVDGKIKGIQSLPLR
ncbi:MAG: hypothetical protein U0136_11065 [Bdellovibrionota bacterium]